MRKQLSKTLETYYFRVQLIRYSLNARTFLPSWIFLRKNCPLPRNLSEDTPNRDLREVGVTMLGGGSEAQRQWRPVNLLDTS
jgi:hypothetical protein